MAVLRDIHHNGLFPAEEEIARPCPCGHRDAEVPVVRHEDEHEEVTDHDLDDVQHGLQEVREAQHLLSENTKPRELSAGGKTHISKEKTQLLGCQDAKVGVKQQRITQQAGHRVLHAAVTWNWAFPH